MGFVEKSYFRFEDLGFAGWESTLINWKLHGVDTYYIRYVPKRKVEILQRREGRR